MSRFKNQAVLITGASSGIGASLARHFAQAGADVALFARRQDRMDTLAKELAHDGGRRLVLPGDVRSEADLANAVATIRSHWHRLDIVIANAGFSVDGRIDRLTIDDYRRQFETNLFGVLITIKATMAALEESKGRLAVVASVAGRVGFPGSSAYCASKFAVVGLCEAIYPELRAKGISLTLINPGFVESEIAQVNRHGEFNPRQKDRRPALLIADTDRVAHTMVTAIYRRRPEVVITQHGKLIVCLKRFVPGLVRMISRKLVAAPI